MPRTFNSAEMEGFYGILYELVCPMLASDNCVKCITEDGSTTFTSDPEHLLRNVDIEHPAGELVLRALQSHKHTFGTGTKTLLFMLASLAKAVVQLSKLGIHSNDSLDVIRDVFTELAKEVEEISIKTNKCFISSKQNNPKRKIKNDDTKNADASYNPQCDRKLIAYGETDAVLTPVVKQHVEKHSLLNVHSNVIHKFGSSSFEKEHCLLPETNVFLHPNLISLNTGSISELCQKSSTASCATTEYNSSATKLVLNSLSFHGSCEEGCSCSEKEMVEMDVTELLDHRVKWKSDDEIQDTQSDSTDPVHLKMSNLQHLCGDSDDIDWFFDDTLSYPGCAEVSTSFAGSHISKNLTKSTDSSISYYLCPGDQDHETNSLDSPEHEIELSCLNVNSLFHDLNRDDKHHENKLITVGGIHSLKDVGQNSSNTMSCFDKYEKNLPVGVSKLISSEELDKKTNVALMQSCPASKHNCVGSESFSNLRHNKLDKDNKAMSANNQFSDKFDEFDACFADIDVQDSFTVCENTVIKHVNDSEFQSSHYMAHSQLSGTYVDDDEIDTSFSDIDRQNSSVICEKAVIKHLGNSEYPLMCQSAVTITNAQQKQLVPEDSRICYGVKVTNSISGTGLKETVGYSNMMSPDILTQRSEMERLNTMLENFGVKKSPVGFPKLSRHLVHTQSKNLQHGEQESSSNDLNRISKHIMETTQCQGYQKETFQDGGILSLDISTYDMKNPLQAQDICVLGNYPDRSSSQLHSEEYPTHQSKNALNTSEAHVGKRQKWNTESQLHLDQLLLQKKAAFRSAITEKIMLSSRHFIKDSGNNMSYSSLLHEDSGLKECTSNASSEFFSNFNDTVTQNLNKPFEDSKEKAQLDSTKDSTSLVQDESFEVQKSSDDELEVWAYSQDHHIDTHARTCVEASEINHLQDSACCHPADILCNLSEEPKDMYVGNQLQEVTDFLHDCKSDVGDVANYIFQNQVKDNEDARFNFHLVNCLLLPSLASLPESFTSAWRSASSPVSVTPGLVIKCDLQILEKLQLNDLSLVTLLVGGDLIPNFRHKGYVPTLPRRTLIAKPQDGNEKSDERVWCADALSILRKLNVKLLLVKGKTSSVLLDMCEGAGVLLLTNISYHTLSVLSHLHRVDIVTYLALATEENLCTVCLQPLSTSWMDHLQDTQLNTANQFAVITGTPQVQTAIIHCSNNMSAQLLEESLWKCLHSIVNSQTDAKVLPAQGRTEIWCAERIRYKSECMLGSQSMVQCVILEAVADIFRDYYQTVMRNTMFYKEKYIQKGNNTEINPALATKCKNYVSFSEQNCLSKINHPPCEIRACFVSETSSESFKTDTGNHMNQNLNNEQDIFKPPEPSIFNNLNTSSADTISDNVSENVNYSSEHSLYDNFKSKISAWKTAVDLVSVLQNLGSLVISGIDTVDITESLSLL